MRFLRGLLIRFWFSVQMAGHGILSNPLRSALTVLGVAIGVASVVSLMGIGEGARQAVVEQFKSLGSNVIVITAKDETVEFEPEEVEDLVDRVQGLTMVTPVVHTKGLMRWRRARGNIDLIGVNELFPEIRDHDLLVGHFFTKWHAAQRSPVAVLGYNVGTGLLRGRSPVGQSFTLEGQTYTIIGVLAEKGKGNGEGIDDKILIPYTTAMRIAEKKTAEEIWAKAGSPNEADLAVVQMGRIFRRKLGIDQTAPSPAPNQGNPEDPGGMPAEVMMKSSMEAPNKSLPIMSSSEDLITITNLNQLVDEANQANRVMTLLLGGIAAVSLLVGGLGIMNIMLVAVTERTGEIGVRRAIGAKQSDLLIQFLLEALYLSGIGSIAGVASGIWGINIFGQYGFETAVSLQAIEIAVGVALGSGLLFGVYPAISASSVPPVEALRR